MKKNLIKTQKYDLLIYTNFMIWWYHDYDISKFVSIIFSNFNQDDEKEGFFSIVYIFAVDCNTIKTEYIINVHNYLIKNII